MPSGASGQWHRPPGQPGLELGAAAAGLRVRHVLFFGLVPEPSCAERLRRLGQELHGRFGLGDPLRPAALLHMSLLGLGAGARLDDSAVVRGLRIGASVRWAQFDVILEAAISFGRGSRRPLVLACSLGAAAAVTGLRDALRDVGEEMGLGGYRYSEFTPHLTLSYTSGPIPETVLDPPVIWRARELVLIYSAQGRGRHVHLGRWPFGAHESLESP